MRHPSPLYRQLTQSCAVLLSLVACQASSSGDTTESQSSSGEDTTQSTETTTQDSQTSGDQSTNSTSETQSSQSTSEETSGGDWTGYFPKESVWYRDVSGAEVSTQSPAIIARLQEQGWGIGRAQIDFSFEILEAQSSTTFRSFEPTDDFYTPDCDNVPVPIPEGGNLEGEDGYTCDNDGDCHLIVYDQQNRRLYEMWRANLSDDTFNGGCLAVWQTDRLYPAHGRGQQCTSSDAAGFPIAPLLVTATEVANDEIRHALRFILPNASIRAGEYIAPATHGTRATAGPADAPPYGVRLRLRADYPLDSLPNEGARAVARALMRYGMLLADAGSILWTFESDRNSPVKWDGLLEPRDLEVIQPADFEVVEYSEPIALTNDCVRSQ